MSEVYDNAWTHLAGNPGRIRAGEKDLLWRYRIGNKGSEHLINGWMLKGRAERGNNRQGVRKGAGFLLWVAVFGDMTVDGSRWATIELCPYPERKPVYSCPQSAAERYARTRLCIVGDSNKVREGKDRHYWRYWKADDPGIEHELIGWRLLGDATAANNSSIACPQALGGVGSHRVWMEFFCDADVDSSCFATIRLL